ncbi:hydantoinase B/oxoprolinase family protein [Sporichthya brevicatena]|uniref:Hydantoinase B/oxoprolinase family protein n=1 Tax=Sporichthya brevicatena TaxID=171442 RepID=A0ABP3RPL2_9ACTN
MHSTATPDGVIRHNEVDLDAFDLDEWNGVKLSYIPRADVPVSPALQLDREFDADPDPITSEVIRWRLWNMNLEHSETLKRASGTPIVCFNDDLNTSLLTENGDTFVGGPTIQYFIGAADLAVKWTLQFRSENPGIHDGDMYMINDPYIASTHQMDTAICAPIFHGGRLFAWTFSAAHQRDLGGGDIGSFGVNATDIYGEPVPWPAVALLRKGELQKDIVELFSRQSRFPELCELQLRAQVAGANSAKRRMLELLDEYGPRLVKGVMRRLIRDTSHSVSERLREIPDGSWSNVTYVNGSGGRQIHCVQMNLRKIGDQLLISNEGTDPQVPGGGNGAYNSFRSTVLAAANTLLAWDHLLCPAGVLNHLQFAPVPGTITCARFPAGVSMPFTPLLSVSQAGQLISSMLLAGPEHMRARAIATGASSSYQGSTTWGVDRDGQPFFGLTGDTMAGGFGAAAGVDGADNGGTYWWPRGNSGNVEEWESTIPFLYLYRRSQRDSGGPGEFRGGNGIEYALLGHKAQTFGTQLGGSHPAVNTTPGLAGGYPGHQGRWLGATDTPIQALLSSGILPADRTALDAACGGLRDLSNGERFDPNADGVLVVHRTAGGGYGDPLRRDPEAVARDVADRALSAEAARLDYGVILDGTVVDGPATGEERARRRAQRLATAEPPRSPAKAPLGRELERQPVTAAVALTRYAEGAVWVCEYCDHVLAEEAVGYRGGSAMWQSTPSDVDAERYPDVRPHVDAEVVLREWYCPGCADILTIDFCLAEDPPAVDVTLAAGAARSKESV